MEIPQYGVFETRFSASVTGNPFDIPFDIVVVQPNGNKKTISGFYDGGTEFVFRFMPEAEGEYSYITISPIQDLNGHTGSFLCVAPKRNDHGKVQIKDQFWFSYADGTPYFDAGTTCYAWIHQSADLQVQTIETLSRGYFSKLRFCVFPKWFEHNHRQPEIYPFEGCLKTGFDYNRPNVVFFRHLETQVAKLKKLGMQADIILFHPYEADNWQFNYMTEEQDKRYLRYIISRLSAYNNVWWSLANEYDLIRIGYKRKRSSWKKLICFVREQDPYGHLTSIHQMRKMYNHRDPNITHCSIQRTEMFLTAEQTDKWREKFSKPVVVDECVYEGDLNACWGGISARELVRRFWEASVRGGYLGHGETYAGENIWWSHGGVLKGESHERIKFLRSIMAGCPNICFSSDSGINSIARASAGMDVQIVYLGFYQPSRYTMHMLGNGLFRVQIIDTWNMTVEELPTPMRGCVEIPLSGKPYIAILCTALEHDEIQRFTRDSVFEQMKLTPGGRRLLKLFKRILPSYYSEMLTMTVSQCNDLAGGILSGKAGDGILRIVNQNEFWRGLWQIITGTILGR